MLKSARVLACSSEPSLLVRPMHSITALSSASDISHLVAPRACVVRRDSPHSRSPHLLLPRTGGSPSLRCPLQTPKSKTSGAAPATLFFPRSRFIAPPFPHPRCSPSGNASRTAERLTGRYTSRRSIKPVDGPLPSVPGRCHGGQGFKQAKGWGRGCVVLPAGVTTAPHPSTPSLAALPSNPRGLATVSRGV
jgi:hypothetical protein